MKGKEFREWWKERGLGSDKRKGVQGVMKGVQGRASRSRSTHSNTSMLLLQCPWPKFHGQHHVIKWLWFSIFQMGNVRQYMRLLGIRSCSDDYDHHANSVACLSSARRKVYHHLKFVILHLQLLIDDKEINIMYPKIILICHILFLICQNFLILFVFLLIFRNYVFVQNKNRFTIHVRSLIFISKIN